ncbi:MAG: Crp/Fnr family transcriptional regulator [Clostridia bacterium]|nr:Crp/Fnr family transcriptional regulator [Clostridia bacterium]
MDLPFLAKTPLFHGLTDQDLKELLHCVNAHERQYHRDEIIYHSGMAVDEIGLVETGSVNMVANFYWGTSSIFSHITRGMIFAENYAAIPGKELLYDIVASEDSLILFLSMDKLLSICASGCPRHNQMIHNLIQISAMNNLTLSSRMMHTAPKTIRARLLSYLSELSMTNGPCFTIPFSRQQLADYLGVDRSALSAEMSRMQKEGLITYHKNDICLSESGVLP